MELSIGENDFLDTFEKIINKDISNKNTMNVFLLNINANEFDYSLLEENLVDPVIGYALSRKIKEKYKERHGTLFKKAVKKFKNYEQNEGELGELMLYCFLETDLKAPKILSKLELKTSNKMYVNGSDGVHYLKLKNGNYQIIFGESKMYKDLLLAIENALESVRQFKEETNNNDEKKSGIVYERGLISDNLNKEFEEEDVNFLIQLIYPKSNNKFYVDDAFGIFIGYEIEITEEEKELENIEFREKIKEKIVNQFKEIETKINEKIKNKNLNGHNFYIYIVPFTNIEKNRKKILGEILN